MSEAPIGTEPSTDGVTSAPVESSTSAAPPTPLEMAEDTLIQIKGQPKPIKFSEYGRGFQAQFTKASQRAAQLEKELANEKAQRAKFEQERQQSRQPNQQPDVFDALRSLPYLTGEDAVGVVQQIGSAIQQRDQVILALANRYQQLEKLVGGLSENHTGQVFDAKIAKWLQEGGYDPGYADLAKEIYLAYEGEDLDNEFPQIFAARVDQIRKIEAAQKASAVAAARRNPFVPGKGGQGSPSKPLDIKANATAKEVADQLFGTWSGQDT